jgi:hypothetical protein
VELTCGWGMGWGRENIVRIRVWRMKMINAKGSDIFYADHVKRKISTHFLAPSTLSLKSGPPKNPAKSGLRFLVSLASSLAGSFSFLGFGPIPCSGTVIFMPKKLPAWTRVVFERCRDGREEGSVCVDWISRRDVLLLECKQGWVAC